MRTPRLLLTSLVLLGLGAAGLPITPAAHASVPARPQPAARSGVARHVVVISVDGLNSRAITRVRTPAIARLVREGASTRNARTEVEQTKTLPNHTGMVTSRRITARRRGHGVDWNDDRRRPRTVQRAAGHPVGSVFSVLAAHHRSAALYASKTKFTLFNRSWDRGVQRMLVRSDNRRLMSAAVHDVVHRSRPFTMVHLSAPDVAGHAHGFMSRAYLNAVAATDDQVRRMVTAIASRPRLAASTTVILTSDHGGRGRTHTNPTRLESYRIPFVVWGAGVARGADLYALNPDLRNPGRARVGYAAARQPVRNGDVANLALDLLGLAAVPHSTLNADQRLDVG